MSIYCDVTSRMFQVSLFGIFTIVALSAGFFSGWSAKQAAVNYLKNEQMRRHEALVKVWTGKPVRQFVSTIRANLPPILHIRTKPEFVDQESKLVIELVLEDKQALTLTHAAAVRTAVVASCPTITSDVVSIVDGWTGKKY